MTTTISPKYQIVIPKAIRRQLHIKPGQKMRVDVGENGTIIVKPADEQVGFDDLSRFAGSIDTAETIWGRQGLDPTVWVRKQRDEDWR